VNSYKDDKSYAIKYNYITVHPEASWIDLVYRTHQHYHCQ